MPSPLLEKLGAWRRFVLRTAGEFAVGRVFLAVAGGMLAVSAADYACYRVLAWDVAAWYPAFWGVVAVLAGWCVWHAAGFLWKFPRTDMDAVRFLRHHSPKDGAVPGTLASAVEFLAAGGVQTGSADLREAVIAETYEKIRPLDLRTAVSDADFWRRRWAVRLAVACVLAAGILAAVLCPEESRAAVARWVTLGEARWPGRVECRWGRAHRGLLRGEDFTGEVEVVSRKNGAPVTLPDYVNVAVLAENADTPEIFRVKPVDGAFWVRIPRMTENFHVTAWAPGEVFSWTDAPRWGGESVLDVRVFPRPCLVNYAIRVIPPAYTGLAERPYDGGWMLRGVSGTRVGILATADRELESARIILSDGTWATGRVRAENPRQVMFLLEIRQTCEYALEMETADGITQRLETWRIEMLEDAPPAVTVIQPRPERVILPCAAVRMKMRGEDDYGLRKMGFRWMLTRDEESPDKETPAKKERWTNFELWPLPGERAAVDVRAHERGFLWNLTQLRLAPGVTVRFQAYAEDGFTQRTEGADVFLTVITEQEMGARLARRWLEMTLEIRRMAGLFEEAGRKLAAEQGGASGEVADIYREVQALFFTAERMLDAQQADSLTVALEEVLTDLEENAAFTLPGGETSRQLRGRVQETRRVMEEIRARRLPAAMQTVASALKEEDLRENEKESRAAILAETREMVRLLAPMLQQFTRAENAAAGVAALARLEVLQREIMAETETLYVENAGVGYDFLQPAARRALEAVMYRQYAIFEQVAEVLARLELPAFPEAEKDAIFLAMQRNDLARAAEIQRAVLFYLREIQARFHAAGEESTLSARMKKMAALAAALEKAVENQRFLSTACAGFAEHPETLTQAETRVQLTHFAELQAAISVELTPFLRDETPETRLPVSVQAVLGGVLAELEASRADFVEASAVKDHPENDPFSDAHTAVFERLTPAQAKILDRLTLLLSAVTFTGEDVLILEEEERRQAKKPEGGENGENEPDAAAEIPQVTVYDIRLLQEMQQETLNRTRAAAEADIREAAELARTAEALLARQEETLALAQQTLGAYITAVMAAKNAAEIATQPGVMRRNDAFSSILEQMTQVVHLFGEYDLGPLNTGIQREIVSGLESCMRRRDSDADQTEIVETDAGTDTAGSDPVPTAGTPGNGEPDSPEPVAPEFQPPLSPSEWGKLPQRVRRQVESLPPQQWPVEYRAMIEAYFRVLATQEESR